MVFRWQMPAAALSSINRCAMSIQRPTSQNLFYSRWKDCFFWQSKNCLFEWEWIMATCKEFHFSWGFLTYNSLFKNSVELDRSTCLITESVSFSMLATVLACIPYLFYCKPRLVKLF